MTTLEIVLALTLSTMIMLFVRLYRKQLILRHIFIKSSDWCGRKIEEVIGSATLTISEMAKDQARFKGLEISDNEAKGFVPFIVSDAKKDWVEQKDALQSQLKRNGIDPLDMGDLDNPVLNPSFTGFKW